MQKNKKNNEITDIIPNDMKYYTNTYDHKMAINNCYFTNNDCTMIRLQCVTLLKMTGVSMIFFFGKNKIVYLHEKTKL